MKDYAYTTLVTHLNHQTLIKWGLSKEAYYLYSLNRNHADRYVNIFDDEVVPHLLFDTKFKKIIER